jgi:hypothetical protein
MASQGSTEPDDGDTTPKIDTSKPHPARIYDYFLGGKDNFAADRETGMKSLQAWPGIRTAARENRAFLRRAVRYLAAEVGIVQFLDIGSGLPSVGNVHEVAQSVNPAAHVVYVDNDPIVLAHSRALLVSKPEGKCAYINADLRNPEHILLHPSVRETLDFGTPIGLILAAVLPFLLDEDEPGRIVKTLVDALPSGSYVAATHGSAEYTPRDGSSEVHRVYSQGGIRAQWRSADEFADLVFRDLTLVPPGVVPISEWRREPGALLPIRAEVGGNAAVARKP